MEHTVMIIKAKQNEYDISLDVGNRLTDRGWNLVFFYRGPLWGSLAFETLASVIITTTGVP